MQDQQLAAAPAAPRRASAALLSTLHLLVVSLLAAAGPRGAAGHGILTKPASRNWVDYLANNYYWPDGLAAGGYQVVGKGGVQWPYGRHGLCGDAADESKPKWNNPGPVQEEYKAGQEVELHVMITTNHYGRFFFRVCPLSAKEDKDCTNLQRADGKGDAWDLPKVAEGSRYNGGAVGLDNLRPMEQWNGFRWYPQPHVDCGYYKHCTRFEGTPVYAIKFRLPKDFKCDKCILQWQYTTGHKCNPPCLKGDRYYPDCRTNPKYAGTYLTNTGYCGEPGTAYPEEFWNCADIKIT
ncbi:MAG: hypothetical protein J3K34DRAFT_407221 [Monoraphidium minutum]|nr:MAG: hypothetical protein J3K34DRAFT_407221 [Monoraphidium minutum]